MRNAEVIRQWNILQAIGANRLGQTVDQLAELTAVTTRTIRRDIEALSVSGFPLYDEVVAGRRRWRLEGRPLAAVMERGFTLQEICAIYFSRSLLETLTGTPFQADLRSAFAKIEAALPPPMRAFLDRVPSLVAAAAPAGSPAPDLKGRDALVAKLMDAVLFRRQADITYFSLSSRRVKTYLVHPYRLVYGLGALYVLAYVESYAAMRTFAVSRLRKVTLREEHFTRDEALASRGHAHSLGVFDGEPVHVEIDFVAEIAPYIKEREWHRSQRLTEHPDGRVTLTLEVCDDWALRSWLLGFGPRARVLGPASLVDRIRADCEAAAAQYSAGAAESADAELHERLQRVLPFWTDKAIGR